MQSSGSSSGSFSRDRSPLRSPPSTPGTPGSTSYEDHIGYLCLVGDMRTSTADNEYVMVNFKINVDEYLTIRVMNPANEPFLKVPHERAIKIFDVAHKRDSIFYNRRIRSQYQVLNYDLLFDPDMVMTNIENITPENTEVNVTAHFYWLDENSQSTSRGGVFRTAILKDGSGQIRFTVWGRLTFAKFKEGECYSISKLTVKLFNGVKVDSTPSTVVQWLAEREKVPRPNMEVYKDVSQQITVNHPLIEAVKIEVANKCNRCNNEVTLELNNMFVKCTGAECGKRFLKRKAVTTVTGTLDIEDGQKIISLSFTKNDILNIIESMDTPAIMEEKLLVLDRSCKVTYDKRVNKLIKIEADQWMDEVPQAILDDKKKTDDDNKENENEDDSVKKTTDDDNKENENEDENAEQ